MLRRANYLSLDANRDVAKVGGDSARCAMLARTALLAVQKAGCAYVPLDPGLPPQRLKFMISDSGVRRILSSGDTAGKLDLPESVEIINVGGIAEKGG